MMRNIKKINVTLDRHCAASSHLMARPLDQLGSRSAVELNVINAQSVQHCNEYCYVATELPVVSAYTRV